MYTDVMVDIETTGTTSFDHTNIIQIAAVKFNYDTEEVDPNFFNMSLAFAPGRYWDESTREWWGKQKPHILQEIRHRAIPADQVIRSFYDWLLVDYPNTDDGLRWWSKPSHFDYSFISSYFNQYNLTNPCHFRFVRDMNSFMAGLKGSPEHPKMEETVDFTGDEHNALHDALYQLKVLFTTKNRFQSMEYIDAS